MFRFGKNKNVSMYGPPNWKEVEINPEQVDSLKVVNNSGLSVATKIKHMKQLSEYRENTLRPHPELRTLFIEMTCRCNEHCRHCGSNCGDYVEEDPLSTEEIKVFLKKTKEQFDIKNIRLCITGGEPLLRKDFFDIMAYAKALGYSWGMTSNGTLITKNVARLLHETGMRTISVSLDGLEREHEWFRQSPGSYRKTIEGIENLIAENGFEHVQITTVITHRNIGDLEQMYEKLSKIGVRSWRVINIEPIGRAKEQPELLLSPEEYKRLFSFIMEYKNKGKMMVTYGCSHYLGPEVEREVRKWYFLCNAGVYTASVMYNGDVTACLDIERRPELIQGNIRRDDFKDIWEKKFEIYRTDYRKKGPCATCKDYEFCAGDAYHTWNFDENRPNLCLKGILWN